MLPCCLWQCGRRTIRDVHSTGPSPTGNQGARHVGHLFHRPRPEEGEGVDGADRGRSSIPVFCTSYICDSCGHTLCRCFVCMCVKLKYDKIVSYLIWKIFYQLCPLPFSWINKSNFFSFFLFIKKKKWDFLRRGYCWKIHLSSFHFFFSSLYICKANKDFY